MVLLLVVWLGLWLVGTVAAPFVSGWGLAAATLLGGGLVSLALLHLCLLGLIREGLEEHAKGRHRQAVACLDWLRLEAAGRRYDGTGKAREALRISRERLADEVLRAIARK